MQNAAFLYCCVGPTPFDDIGEAPYEKSTHKNQLSPTLCKGLRSYIKDTYQEKISLKKTLHHNIQHHYKCTQNSSSSLKDTYNVCNRENDLMWIQRRNEHDGFQTDVHKHTMLNNGNRFHCKAIHEVCERQTDCPYSVRRTEFNVDYSHCPIMCSGSACNMTNEQNNVLTYERKTSPFGQPGKAWMRKNTTIDCK